MNHRGFSAQQRSGQRKSLRTSHTQVTTSSNSSPPAVAIKHCKPEPNSDIRAASIPSKKTDLNHPCHYTFVPFVLPICPTTLYVHCLSMCIVSIYSAHSVYLFIYLCCVITILYITYAYIISGPLERHQLSEPKSLSACTNMILTFIQ